MEDSAHNLPDTSWDRDRTTRFLGMGLCLADCIVYALGGTLIPLILGILFAVAGVGLKYHKRWAPTLAATLVVIAVGYELLYVIAGRGTLLGTGFRALLHGSLLIVLLINWTWWSRKREESDLGQRGAV